MNELSNQIYGVKVILQTLNAQELRVIEDYAQYLRIHLQESYLNQLKNEG